MSKNILVLFSYRNHKYGYIEMLFERLSQAAKKHDLQLFRGSLSDMHITVINNKLSVVESLTGRDITSYDTVYFELWYKAQQQALATATYARRHSVPFFSKELLRIMPTTKIGELAVLADNDIMLPNSFMSSAREIKKVFKKNPPFTYPIIVKAADGYGGKNNFLVHTYAELRDILRIHKDLRFVIQEYIPNDCDYRCLVMGGEISFVLKRSRSAEGESHLNNTSQGALGESVPLSTIPRDAQDAVIRAATVLDRDEFAGVDLMFNSETGQYYILEVNQTPQIENGAEIDKKMTALLTYIERLSNGN